MRKLKILLTLIIIALSAIIITSCKKDEPVADFTFIIENKPAPCEVSFTNTSIFASDYYWEFGDGKNSYEKNPIHTYTSGGTYSVQLKATGEGGTNLITKSISIQNVPTKLKINSIVLTEMPFTNTDGWDWDIVDGPDVYCQLWDETITNLYFDSDYFGDILRSDLPLTFTKTGTFVFQISNFDLKYVIPLLDYDYPNDPDIIGLCSFKVRDYMPIDNSPYPSTFNLTTTESTLTYTLNVEWVQ